MSTVNLEPNSHRYKEEQKTTEKKEIKKVVTGPVSTKKKSEASKIASKFISEDSANLKSYLVDDLIIPTLKKLVVNALCDSVETIFGVNSRGGRDRDGRRDERPYVSYRSYSERRDDRRDDRPSHRFDYDQIEFSSRGEAESVLDEMYDTIRRYKIVTVADMYDMCGLTAPYTARNYGWTSIRNAEVKRVRNGKYVIDIANAYPID